MTSEYLIQLSYYTPPPVVFTLAAEAGSYVEVGPGVEWRRTYNLASAQGSYVETGQAANLFAGAYALAADAGEYLSSGGASLEYSGFSDIGDIAGVEYYFKTNDPTSITDTAGLVSAHANQKVGEASGAAGASGPQTGARTINSVNVFDYDSGESMVVSTGETAPASMSFGVVVEFDSIAGNQIVLSHYSGLPWFAALISGGVFALTCQTNTGTTSASGGSPSTGTPYILAGRVRSGATDFYVNGTLIGSDAEVFSSINTITGNLTIGHAAAGVSFNGSIGNWFMAYANLSDDEMNNACGKLASDYSITWTDI